MKLNEFVKMFKNFSKSIKEQKSDGTCFGTRGHDLDFNQAMDLLNLYAQEKKLTSQTAQELMSSIVGTGECSPALVDLIKIVQSDLGVENDGIIGKATLGALLQSLEDHPGIGDLKIGKSKKVTIQKKPSQIGSEEDIPQPVIDSNIRDRLLFVGDSIAKGMYSRGNDSKGTSIAVGGSMSKRILSDFTKYISKNPKNTGNKIVILSAGTNDVFSGAVKGGEWMKASTPISNIKKIVSLANQSGYSVYVMKLMEDGKENRTTLNKYPFSPEKHLKLVKEVNKAIDSFNNFNDLGTQLDRDGIHPTSSGYKALVSEALVFITAQGETGDLKPTSKQAPVVDNEEDLPPIDFDTESDAQSDLDGDQPPEPELASMLYDGVNAPLWLQSGPALRLLTVLEDFGSEEEIHTSMDAITREAMKKLNVRTPEASTPLGVSDIKKFQSKVGITSDGDLGPMTFGAAALLNSKYADGTLSEGKSSSLYNSFGSKTLKNRMEKLLESSTSRRFGVVDPNKYVDECASSSSLRKAARALKNSGNTVRTPPRALGRKRATPLNSWREDTEFLNKTEALAKKYNMTRAQLLALFYHETAGTMSPRMENKWGFTGLIQFGTMEGGVAYRKKGGKLKMGAPIVAVGRVMGRQKGDEITKKELKSMSRAEQVDAVEAYFKMWKIDRLPQDEFMLGRIYTTILYPIARAFKPDEAIMAQSMEDYNHNKYTTERKQKAIKAFKVNGAWLRKKGKRMMTIRDLHEKMNSHISRAKLDF